MKNIIVGVTGASGAPLAICLLKEMQKISHIQTHLVATKSAKLTLKLECDIDDLHTLVDVVYSDDDIGASIASGTFKADGMIVIPCSMKSVSAIKNGLSNSLLQRAADVCIKEKRKLILVPRETPLSPIHLDNLTYLSKLQNVTILPPMLSYYHKPTSIKELEYHLVGKILSFFDVDLEDFKRWK